jgi:transposase InsO family protein
LEVLAGVPVTEVAERYGVSRQSVHTWLRRYREEGPLGLADRSHRPREHPWRLDAVLEAQICELRRAHPSWGPRRLVFEMDRGGYGLVTRSTVYRTLVRNGLIEPKSRRRRRDQYRRWERPVAMELWQMDVTASLFLSDGRELKIVTGIDDHSRFCVLAEVVRRATSRAVCRAFRDAMLAYGVPEEVLTDNGVVFTGKYLRPRPPGEVLFDRMCRENGIVHRLTKVRSPTTTGKIERLHQTLQDELLNVHGPFDSLEQAQAAVDGWRDEYNQNRPHQSLGMKFPAARFDTRRAGDLALQVPPDLSVVPSPPTTASAAPATPAVPVVEPPPPLPGPEPVAAAWNPHMALEVDRVVPPSGNMWLAGQQVWLGPVLAGKRVTFWVDQTRLHVLLDGVRLKTLPSRLSVIDLSKLAAAGGRPAGPSPLPAAGQNVVIELERTVNGNGLISLVGRYYSIGFELSGRRVTLRLDGPLMHVTADGQLIKTLGCPVPLDGRHRLRGARVAPNTALARPDAVRVQRRVCPRGSIRVATQKIQVGLAHAGKTVTIVVESDVLRIEIDPDLTQIVARTSTKEVNRYKVHAVERTSRVRKASTEAKL